MKTENKFKVGDRVKCFGQAAQGGFDCVSIDGDYGEVLGITTAGFVSVGLDQDYGVPSFQFHPKQLRRLKPKAKPRAFVGRWKKYEISPMLYEIAFALTEYRNDVLELRDQEMTLREIKK